MDDRPAGPWRLVEQLRAYATVTSWCEWFELSGSLGRGAGDEWSDVDAALGVHPDTPLSFAVDAALFAARTFAPVAAELTTPFGTGPAAHHALQYADGRQLSLVVMPAAARSGLPDGAVAVVDRGGRLSRPFPPSVLTAEPSALREWAFTAWWQLGDAAKHLRRGSLWRAVTALDAARVEAWRLHAAAVDVPCPLFGAVSVENAGGRAPDWMAATIPAAVDAAAVGCSVTALAGGLTGLTAASVDRDVIGLRAVVRDSLSRAGLLADGGPEVGPTGRPRADSEEE